MIIYVYNQVAVIGYCTIRQGSCNQELCDCNSMLCFQRMSCKRYSQSKFSIMVDMINIQYWLGSYRKSLLLDKNNYTLKFDCCLCKIDR